VHDCSDIRIRRARPEDAEPLAGLAARLFRETYEDDVAAADLAAFVAESFSVERQAEELEDPATITLLVERAGETVGYAQVRRRPVPDQAGPRHATAAELARLYLDRSCHGRGVAQAVLQETAAASQGLGASELWLGVWERNARAISFYAKSGFRRTGAHEFRVAGEVHRDVIMRAPLAALL
jgi:diamine N-acetyltransferase